MRPQLRDAVEEMKRVLDVGPVVAGAAQSADVSFTRRWAHGAIHDRTAPMRSHVVMTYFGEPQRIDWRDGTLSQTAMTRPGAITLIPAGHEARWDVHGPIEVSHVYISRARLTACAEAMRVHTARLELLDRVAHEDPVASRLLQLLAIEAETAESAELLMHERLIDLLCIQLLRAHSSLRSAGAPVTGHGLSRRQVKIITEYLAAHLGQDVGLDELADLVGVSRFHVCTAFRRATGVPPHRWLLLRRMTEARHMLSEPNLSIAEIGMALGYQSPSAFSAAFRKVSGVTPLQFRRHI